MRDKSDSMKHILMSFVEAIRFGVLPPNIFFSFKFVFVFFGQSNLFFFAFAPVFDPPTVNK